MPIPRIVLLCALDLSIYGCAIASLEIAAMLERVRVDGSLGRLA